MQNFLNTKISLPAIFFTHGGCHDGLTAAGIAHQVLPRSTQIGLAQFSGIYSHPILPEEIPNGMIIDGKSTNTNPRKIVEKNLPPFIGCSPRSKIDFRLITSETTVYMFDITFPLDAMINVIKKAKRLVVLDHHEGARDVIDACREYANSAGCEFECVLDVTECGSTLAWKYFHPDNDSCPRLLRYIHDNDLWLNKINDSEAIYEALRARRYIRNFGSINEALYRSGMIPYSEDIMWMPKDADAYNAGVSMFMNTLIVEGKAIIASNEIDYDRIIASGRYITVNVVPKSTECSLSPTETVMPVQKPQKFNAYLIEDNSGKSTQIGNRALETRKCDFVICYRINAHQRKLALSIRSLRADQITDGRDAADLSWISKRIIGACVGGGHPGAAGVTIPGTDIFSVFETTV